MSARNILILPAACVLLAISLITSPVAADPDIAYDANDPMLAFGVKQLDAAVRSCDAAIVDKIAIAVGGKEVSELKSEGFTIIC